MSKFRCSIVIQFFNHMADLINDYAILSWYVRGLNNRAGQEDVKQVLQAHKPMIVCLQEPLHKLFQYAQRMSMLQRINVSCTNFRVSLYGDDAAVSIKPTSQDYAVTTQF